MKALVGAFNQEKALLGAFSVIVKTGCGTEGALHRTRFISRFIPRQRVQCPQTRRVQEASQFISNVISPADRRHNYTAPSHGQLIINFCFNCFTSALPPPGPGDSRRRVIGIKFLRGARQGWRQVPHVMLQMWLDACPNYTALLGN